MSSVSEEAFECASSSSKNGAVSGSGRKKWNLDGGKSAKALFDETPKRLRCRLSNESTTARVKLFGREYQPSPDLFKHFRGHKDEITAIDFHPNLHRVLSGSKDGYVMCWDYDDDSARTLRFEGRQKAITSVAYNRDGDLMLSASDDATIRIWVPTMRGDSRVFKAHHSAITSLACSPEDPNEFVSASTDKTIKFWSISHAVSKPPATCVPKLRIGNHQFLGSNVQNSWIVSVRYQPNSNGKIVCTAAVNGTLSIIDQRGANLVTTIKSRLLENVKCAEFNPTSNPYIAACSEDRLQIFDIRNQKVIQMYTELHTGTINAFAFHPSGQFAFTASADKKIKILDLVEGRPIFTVVGPTEPVLSIAASKDGTLFATGGVDKNLLIWKPFLMLYSTEELTAMDEQLPEDDIPDEDPNVAASAEFYNQILTRRTEDH